MSALFEKFTRHQKGSSTTKLCSKDINNLFHASSYLRNPLALNNPTLVELASIANMGVTKFKMSFKKLFGSAPIQYRNKIRMEFARTEIVFNKRSPTEVSYMLGYSHPSNFTVAFKQHFGELPSSKG
jgi:AraC-like DNA-binding protein